MNITSIHQLTDNLVSFIREEGYGVNFMSQEDLMQSYGPTDMKSMFGYANLHTQSIFIDWELHPIDELLTVCHEYAHIILHTSMPENIDGETLYNIREYECRYVEWCVLDSLLGMLPSSLLEPHLEAIEWVIDELKRMTAMYLEGCMNAPIRITNMRDMDGFIDTILEALLGVQ